MSHVSHQTLPAGACVLVAAAGILVALGTESCLCARVGPELASLGGGLASETAHVNATILHNVRGGTGSAVIPLHGFPEDSYAYHHVMPLLAKQSTDVADDLRGIGGSAASAGNYDAANMAEDVHQLVEHQHLKHDYVVGHDVGGMVAYAFARRYPETSGGMILPDAPLPGLSGRRKAWLIIPSPVIAADKGRLKAQINFLFTEDAGDAVDPLMR
jgi:pimeloyl-ACP methyl ester carboxylesterase